MTLLPCSAGMSGPAETGNETHAHRRRSPRPAYRARHDATHSRKPATVKGRVIRCMRRKTKLPPKGIPPDDPDPARQARGMIPFPCCPSGNVMVYADSHGRSSIKCPKCGRFAVFDYDEMSAEPCGPCRGAAEQYKATPQ